MIKDRKVWKKNEKKSIENCGIKIKFKKIKLTEVRTFSGKEAITKKKSKKLVNKENCVEKQLEKLKKKLFCMKFKW